MAETLTERLVVVAQQLEGVDVPEIAALVREAALRIEVLTDTVRSLQADLKRYDGEPVLKMRT